MRICIVLASWDEGGLERHTIELANALALQHEVSVVVHPVIADRFAPDVQVYTMNLDRNRQNPFLLYELWTILKNNHFDIIHAQASKAAIIVAPLLKYLKKPSVVTVHGIKNNIRPFLRFDQIIAVSGTVAEKFPKRAAINVVWNGLDVIAPSASKPTTNSRIQAIAIGRLVEVKGFDLLVAAWQGIDADLWIVGEGKEHESLTQQVNALNLTHRIKLLGHRDDIAELIAAADCLVISSRREGGPYTLAEALLLDTPVLATRVGMVADFLPEDYICPASDTSALHELLNRHLNRSTSKTNFGDDFAPAYRKAKAHLTFQGMLENTLAIYTDVIEKYDRPADQR